MTTPPPPPPESSPPPPDGNPTPPHQPGMHAEFMTNFLTMSADERAHASSDLDRAVAAVRRAETRHPATTTTTTPATSTAPLAVGGENDTGQGPVDEADAASTAAPGDQSPAVSNIAERRDRPQPPVGIPDPAGDNVVGIPSPPSTQRDTEEHTAAEQIDNADNEEATSPPPSDDPIVEGRVRIADDDDSLIGNQLTGPDFVDPLASGMTVPPADAATGNDEVDGVTVEPDPEDDPGNLPNRTLADMFGENAARAGGRTAAVPVPDEDPYSVAQTPGGGHRQRTRRTVLDDADDSAVAPTEGDADDIDETEQDDAAGERSGRLGASGRRARAWAAGARTRIRDLSFRTKVIGGVATALAVVLFIAYLAWPSGEQPAGSTAPPPQTQQPAPGTDESDGVVMPAARGLEVDCANGSTSPSLAFTNDASKAWQCMRYYSSDNVTLTITFSKPVTISRITFVPGWNYVEPSGVDNWAKWRVVTQVLWVIGNNQYAQTVTPTRSGVEQKISPPISTTSIQMVIQQTAPSSGNDDKGSILDGGWSKTVDGFAISNIRIYGRESQ